MPILHTSLFQMCTEAREAPIFRGTLPAPDGIVFSVSDACAELAGFALQGVTPERVHWFMRAGADGTLAARGDGIPNILELEDDATSRAAAGAAAAAWGGRLGAVANMCFLLNMGCRGLEVLKALPPPVLAGLHYVYAEAWSTDAAPPTSAGGVGETELTEWLVARGFLSASRHKLGERVEKLFIRLPPPLQK